ncbi:MAG: serpin family protein [Calothrix sp. C42_A2020_038]|nr:serpin family protein [Calothrix sp. C42_A2020_038]
MQQKSSQHCNKFLQRRYGVRLGRRYALAAAGVVLMGVIGCSPLNSESSAVTARQPLTESPMSQAVNPDTKLVAGNTKFGFKLFSEVLKKNQGANVFVSPSSIAMALAMTYNGASGSTQQAMAKALEYSGLSLQQINSSYAALKEILENPDPKVQLTIANSLWANSSASLNPDFLQRNREYYKARVTNLNFNESGAADQINNWVKDSTRGKINKIVEQISPDQVMFLINAIYFKGAWTEPFDKSQTKNYPFYLASGQQKQLPMMSQRGDYRYLENENFQAVSLPYGKDGKISFYVFLPKKNSSLQQFYQSLNTDNWEKWMSQFSKRDGEIRIPRFKIDYDVTLNDALTALGMGEAFSDKADFSGIGENLAISTVKHKTFVEVSEEGTEAAAATSVGIVALSAPVKPPFSMIVDRPFFTCIRDNQTGSILFMGSIAAPQS